MPSHPGYDTHLFIEIILSEGAQLIPPVVEIDGVHIEYYMGPSGYKVPFCIEDEYLSVNACKMYLDQLGLASLIERLFPD